MRGLLVLAISLSAGCGTMIEPGHLGLLFKPYRGGVQRDVLRPGYHYFGARDRVDDFDITYSTHREELHTISSEGLGLDLVVSVIYRPIIAELYELDSEIGLNYYDEVLGPEFRTATRGVFARHSYLEVQRMNEKVEDEVEAEVRRRIRGKHIEISSVTMESVQYAPEIADAVRAKLVGEQEAIRKKTALLAEAERAKLEGEAFLKKKQGEHVLAEEQATIDKVRAETEAAVKLTRAKAEAEEISMLAKARGEQKRAENVTLTPLAVMMHAYDALAKLGGEGTSIMLGDWSKVPGFLFPQALLSHLQTASQKPAQ